MKQIDRDRFNDYMKVHLHNPFLIEYDEGLSYVGLVTELDWLLDDVPKLTDVRYCKFDYIYNGVRAGMYRIIESLDDNFDLCSLLLALYPNRYDIQDMTNFIYMNSICRYDSLPDLTSREFQKLVESLALLLCDYRIPSNIYQLAFLSLPDYMREFFVRDSVIDANVPF